MRRRLATYELYANATVYLSALLATVLGASILFGGPARFSSPGFATARLLPGQHVSWGAVLMAFGLMMALGVAMEWHTRMIMTAFLGQACWYGFLALTLGVSAFRDPHVAFTGVCAYAALAALCVLGWACGEGLRQG